ncbi:MAG: UDP-N-acetylmuramoyl-L-alanine--D-glutamate ligase [Proteobacteria bacterium]|nr:UDP-N-acetylmuramoyl-L-alanine--D-glutamate ligase [Pseudomonadota bacterium]
MSKNNLHVIIGLGATGLSCVRFLKKQNIPVVVADTREAPPHLAAFKQQYPDIEVYTGNTWPQEILNGAQALVVSPGVAVTHSSIQKAKDQGVEVIGDVELFARYNKAPVIAITGANGKSTVTTLVGEMAKCAGKKVAVIGNIGTPVLDVFDENQVPELVVMELSSFQLETTHSLAPLAATILNITPDHLDRYASFEEYASAKHRIHKLAKQVIINKQDPLSASNEILPTAKKYYFTLNAPQGDEFGLQKFDGQIWLCFGTQKLICADELKIVGLHNLANALSALALGYAVGLSWESMFQALRTFPGLDHRCQLVAKQDGIQWINDSKGTNIGACQAALEGIGQGLEGKIVLILGGDGKGADFGDLAPLVSIYCRAIIVMGKDSQKILEALDSVVAAFCATNMEQAVELAKNCAKPNDVVLLSPACSSLDQYQHFAHRGEVFMQCVYQTIERAKRAS